MKSADPLHRTRSVRIGNTNVLIRGIRSGRLGDPYHFILKLSWPRFFAVLVLLFWVVNLLFGIVYWMLPGSVANVPQGAFIEYVFFSIETLATVGYGVMSPATIAGHLVASFEILVGMVSVALVTGLVFVRFAKPTSRFMFSDRALVRDFEGGRVLMLRVANERHNRIVGANAKLSLVRLEINLEGESYFRIHDLPLVRDSTQIFALTWTLMHTIDENSPLRGMTPTELDASRSRILVTVTGHDEIMAAEIRAVHEYQFGDIVFDGRYADVLHSIQGGGQVVDLTRFHEIETPAPGAHPRGPA